MIALLVLVPFFVFVVVVTADTLYQLFKIERAEDAASSQIERAATCPASRRPRAGGSMPEPRPLVWDRLREAGR